MTNELLIQTKNSKMKKFTILFVEILMFSITTVNAQLSVAPKLGINFANLGGDLEDNKIRLRGQIGGIVNYEINDMFSVQPGLLLSGKGTTLKYDSDDNDAIALTYLEIPLNGLINIETDAGMVQVFAGPYLAFCIDATYKYLSDEDNETRSFTIGTNDEDEFVPFELGINLGVGFLYDEKIQTQLGFATSLTDIGNYNDKLTNSIISLSLAYFFELD